MLYTEGLSLRGSLSDSSEALLQRGKGGVRIFRSFCNQSVKQSLPPNQVVRISKDCHYLMQTKHLKLMNLALSYVWEDAKL